jgi:ribonuclease BN (tRNA processing enzyme)
MKVVFLGTNGWYSTGLGNTSCTLIETEKFYVVLDAGDGIHKLDEYVKTEKPIVIFLSHLHLDHIIGFHVFNKFRFKQNVSIYGYKGTKNGLRIISHPYTASFDEVPLRIDINELKEGRYSEPFPFTCKLLFHADQCLGYRLELDDKVIAYCTDTGLCENIFALSKGADLLIAECSLKPEQSESGWPHLRPEDAARVAKEADVGRLALMHFDANMYKSMEDRKNAETAARKIFLETVAAVDGLEILI